MPFVRSRCLTFVLILFAASLSAQQPATSGTFVLHKFAKSIGQETYSIATTGDTSTLTSHFLCTDRGSKVPLETTFLTHSADGSPISYAAKGRSSRLSEMNDTISVSGASLSITRNGKAQTQTPAGAWFITDGYSPVAMQEQMMSCWLQHAKPPHSPSIPPAAPCELSLRGP